MRIPPKLPKGLATLHEALQQTFFSFSLLGIERCLKTRKCVIASPLRMTEGYAYRFLRGCPEPLCGPSFQPYKTLQTYNTSGSVRTCLSP